MISISLLYILIVLHGPFVTIWHRISELANLELWFFEQKQDLL